MTKIFGSRVGKLCVAVMASAVLPAVALAQANLAPGIAKAPDFTPTSTPYVVTNGGPLYKSPVADYDQLTKMSLNRGEHPQVLGETSGGAWLLIGKGGQGIGYIQRGLLCPAAVCKDVRPEPAAKAG